MVVEGGDRRIDLDAPVGLELLGDARVDVAVGPDDEVEASTLLLGATLHGPPGWPKAPPDSPASAETGRGPQNATPAQLPFADEIVAHVVPPFAPMMTEPIIGPLPDVAMMRARSRPWIKRPDAGRGGGMKLLSLRAGRLASISRRRPADRSPASRPMVRSTCCGRRRPRRSPRGAATMPPAIRWCRSPIASRTAASSSTAARSCCEPNWPGVRHPMHGDGWAQAVERRAQRRPLRRHRLRA